MSSSYSILTPSQDLVDLASDIFSQAWEVQAATAGEQRDQLIKEGGDCRRQITQFADRAVATDVPEVVAAYEQRIRELRIREIAIGDRLSSSGAVQPEFDQRIEPPSTFWQALGNYGVLNDWKTVLPF